VGLRIWQLYIVHLFMFLAFVAQVSWSANRFANPAYLDEQNVDAFLETPYEAAPNGMLFRRYDLMRHWAETGQVDVERAPRAAWPRETDRLHACLGLALAETIALGMRLS
jgi:hypothetical protein